MWNKKILEFLRYVIPHHKSVGLEQHYLPVQPGDNNV